MARHVHIHFHDAGEFEESKHPRAENGQFGNAATRPEHKEWTAQQHAKAASKHTQKQVAAVSLPKPPKSSLFHPDYYTHGKEAYYHMAQAKVKGEQQRAANKAAKAALKGAAPAKGASGATPVQALKNKLATVAPGPIVAERQAQNDPDLALIAERGRAFHKAELAPGRQYIGPDAECHWNTAKLYRDGKIDSVVIGYAKNSQGWHQHTWGLKNGKVVETTPSNVGNDVWFGVPLDAKQSTIFTQHVLKPSSAPGNGNVRTHKGGHRVE